MDKKMSNVLNDASIVEIKLTINEKKNPKSNRKNGNITLNDNACLLTLS